MPRERNYGTDTTIFDAASGLSCGILLCELLACLAGLHFCSVKDSKWHIDRQKCARERVITTLECHYRRQFQYASLFYILIIEFYRGACNGVTTKYNSVYAPLFH